MGKDFSSRVLYQFETGSALHIAETDMKSSPNGVLALELGDPTLWAEWPEYNRVEMEAVQFAFQNFQEKIDLNVFMNYQSVDEGKEYDIFIPDVPEPHSYEGPNKKKKESKFRVSSR